MIDYEKIKEISARKGVLDIVVEKDYILDWILWGISQNRYFSNSVVFKGGTALHKMYFSDWRFSEDLDFTTISKIEKNELQDAIEKLYKDVTKQSGIDLKQKDITPSGEKDSEWSFELKTEYIGPRKQTGSNLPTITFHITNDELLMDTPKNKITIAPYEDLPEQFAILTYSLEEILAEKIRTVLHQRCWAKDIYDTWKLLREAKGVIDIARVLDIYNRKTIYKKLKPGIPSDINERILRIETQWKEGLQRQIGAPPNFEVVYPEVLELLKKLFTDYTIIKKGGVTMVETQYVIKYKKGDLEIEVQGDRTFVEEKFKELLGIKLSAVPQKESIISSETSVLPSSEPKGETGKRMSLSEFMNTKNPKGHDDKILVFGYYIEKFEKSISVNVDDIKKCYQQAKIPPTKNIPTYTSMLERKGYIMASEEKKDNKKAWQLTQSGEKYIENLDIENEKE